MNSYPYLQASLFLVVIAIALGAMVPAHRRSLLYSGLLSVPSALVSFLFIPEYWDPKVLGHFIASPEDMLFSGAMGSIAWFLAIVPFAGQIESNIEPSNMLRRAVFCHAVGMVSYGLCSLAIPAESMVMVRMLVSILAVGVTLLWLRADMWKPALFGSCGLVLQYGVSLFLFLEFWPFTEAYWNPVAQLPFTVFGIPAFELMWALAFGFTWPLMVAFVFNITWKENQGPRVNRARSSHERV